MLICISKRSPKSSLLDHRNIRVVNAQHGGSLSAESKIEYLSSDQIRITLRESWTGIIVFISFVTILMIVLHRLMPAAQSNPMPLVCVVVLTCIWSGIARNYREEYFFNHSTHSIRVLRQGLFGKKVVNISAKEISFVRLSTRGVETKRHLVELIGSHEKVRVRLPNWVNTLTIGDQQRIGQLVSELLDVPLQAT